MKEDNLLKIIFKFFVDSHDFNGIPLTTLSKKTKISYLELIEKIKSLVIDDFVSIQTGENPHIIRLGHYEKETQIKILEESKANKTKRIGNISENVTISYDSYLVCVYPSSKYLIENRNIENLSNVPYTSMLALGEPQLKPMYFATEVLDRYFNDPRYSFRFEDYSGQICYKEDENHIPLVNETDQIFLKSFGLGFNNKSERIAVVYLCYLKNLTEEHQKYWKSKEIKAECHMLREYFDNTIIGNFTNSYSVFSAFIEEQKAINDLTNAIFGISLFNRTFEEEKRPKEFTFFFTPTLKNYHDFVLLLDKMISDNINKSFFESQIELYEYKKISNGVVERIDKGTLKLLEEWFPLHFRIDELNKVIDLFKPLKRIRQERQAPAHKINENIYDKILIDEQIKLIKESYFTMRTLRVLFQKDPKARNVKVQKWLDTGVIKTF